MDINKTLMETCLNCGKDVKYSKDDICTDDFGEYIICPNCGASSDINVSCETKDENVSCETNLNEAVITKQDRPLYDSVEDIVDDACELDVGDHIEKHYSLKDYGDIIIFTISKVKEDTFEITYRLWSESNNDIEFTHEDIDILDLDTELVNIIKATISDLNTPVPQKDLNEAINDGADKSLYDSVEDIAEEICKMNPGEDDQYEYDSNITFSVYRDEDEFSDLFNIYVIYKGQILDELDTGDVHLSDLDTTLVNLIENIENSNMETTEYTITFNDGELYNEYSGEFTSEDKDEADELFNKIKSDGKLDQVNQYYAKTWIDNDGDFIEGDVDVYYTEGDILEESTELKGSKKCNLKESYRYQDLVSAGESLWRDGATIYDTDVDGIYDCHTAGHGGYLVDTAKFPELAKYGDETCIDGIVGFEEDYEALKVIWAVPEVLSEKQLNNNFIKNLTIDQVTKYDNTDDFKNEFPERRTAQKTQKKESINKKIHPKTESNTLDDVRYISTGLNDDKAFDVLDSVIGQMSDGIWENSSQMNRYWPYARIEKADGELQIKIDDPAWESGFYGKSDDAIRKFFANKIKQIAKEYIDDYKDEYPDLKWDRACDRKCIYLDNNTDVTIQDAYRVYDKLMGRIDRIKTESVIYDTNTHENVSSSYKVNRLFLLLKDYTNITPEEWNKATREERDNMVRGGLEEFYKDNKVDIDNNWKDLYDLLEANNYHTENRILYEIIKNNKDRVNESKDASNKYIDEISKASTKDALIDVVKKMWNDDSSITITEFCNILNDIVIPKLESDFDVYYGVYDAIDDDEILNKVQVCGVSDISKYIDITDDREEWDYCLDDLDEAIYNVDYLVFNKKDDRIYEVSEDEYNLIKKKLGLNESKTDFDGTMFAQWLPMSYTDYVDSNIAEYVNEIGLDKDSLESFISKYREELDEEDKEEFNDDLALNYIYYVLSGFNKTLASYIEDICNASNIDSVVKILKDIWKDNKIEDSQLDKFIYQVIMPKFNIDFNIDLEEKADANDMDTYQYVIRKYIDDEKLDESKNLNERGLTRAERHNRNMERIFNNYNAQLDRMADYLKQNGFSDEEITELRNNTGLGASALPDKAKEVADKNGPNEWHNLCYGVTESKKLNENTDLSEVRWDEYEDYDEDEIAEINSYLVHSDLTVVQHEGNKTDGYSVAVKDNNSGLIFWMDYSEVGHDIYEEWNQYIFSTRNSIDRIKSAMQSAYTDDWSFRMDVDEVCMRYLEDKGLIKDTDEGMVFEAYQKDLDEAEQIKTTIGEVLEEIENATSVGEIFTIADNVNDESFKKVIMDEIEAIEYEFPDVYDMDEDSDEYDDILQNLISCISSDFGDPDYDREVTLNESKDWKELGTSCDIDNKKLEAKNDDFEITWTNGFDLDKLKNSIANNLEDIKEGIDIFYIENRPENFSAYLAKYNDALYLTGSKHNPDDYDNDFDNSSTILVGDDKIANCNNIDELKKAIKYYYKYLLKLSKPITLSNKNVEVNIDAEGLNEARRNPEQNTINKGNSKIDVTDTKRNKFRSVDQANRNFYRDLQGNSAKGSGTWEENPNEKSSEYRINKNEIARNNDLINLGKNLNTDDTSLKDTVAEINQELVKKNQDLEDRNKEIIADKNAKKKESKELTEEKQWKFKFDNTIRSAINSHDVIGIIDAIRKNCEAIQNTDTVSEDTKLKFESYLDFYNETFDWVVDDISENSSKADEYDDYMNKALSDLYDLCDETDVFIELM